MDDIAMEEVTGPDPDVVDTQEPNNPVQHWNINPKFIDPRLVDHALGPALIGRVFTLQSQLETNNEMERLIWISEGRTKPCERPDGRHRRDEYGSYWNPVNTTFDTPEHASTMGSVHYENQEVPKMLSPYGLLGVRASLMAGKGK
ncbi:hypothetical protein DL769_011452 [Monosporascus sp. CRB-8-3]|nr:hypothetical protein DL769_011452 [Monosporascus sp. CRB-8-3]